MDRVIFLYEHNSAIKSFTDVYAVFLNTFDPATETYECYSHIGQHSTCSKAYCLECELAEPDDFMGLYSELENNGYALDVIQNLEELRLC